MGSAPLTVLLRWKARDSNTGTHKKEVSAEYNIVFEVEGLDSNGGHVRLDRLLVQLKALELSLQNMERLVDTDDEATLYYRVVNVSHSSPIKFELEPVLRPKRKKIVDRNLLKRHHDRYFGELEKIRRKQAPSPDVSNEMLETIQKILAGEGKDFKKAIIRNGSEKVDLDQNLRANLDYFLREESSSVGSYQGRLEALNLHAGVNTFWIYPSTGAQRINCKFPPGSKEAAKSALEKTVIVTGTKFYRPKANFPHRINVTEFEVVSEEPKHLADLGGIMPTDGSETSEQTINRIRNEWD
jgi:hypothetical protein